MPIKTQSAKNKARELQKHICKKIKEAFPWLKDGDTESRSMGASGVDIMLSPLARKTFPVSIEAKKTRKHPAAAEMKQAKHNVYPDTIAAVAWCPHGSGHDKTMITFDLNDFLEWYKKIRKEALLSIALHETVKDNMGAKKEK